MNIKYKVKAVKNKMKRKLEWLKSLIIKNLSDLLVFIALILIGFNSCMLNIIFGLYVIALELILIAFFINQKRR